MARALRSNGRADHGRLQRKIADRLHAAEKSVVVGVGSDPKPYPLVIVADGESSVLQRHAS